MTEILEKLVVTVPAAVAVIVTVALFLRRMRESQEAGHKVAQDMQDAFEKNLERSYQVHERIMQQYSESHRTSIDRLGSLVERSIEKQEQTVEAIRALNGR